MEKPRRSVRMTVRTFESNVAKLEAIAKRLGLFSRGAPNLSAALNLVLEHVDMRRYKKKRRSP